MTQSIQMTPSSSAESIRFKVLGAISFSHFLNDMIQSLLLAIYPLLKGIFSLNFTQIGLITLTYQITASLLQPLIGLYTDKYPKPYSLAMGMGSTLTGLLILSAATHYDMLLVAAALMGVGSSVFHPESSRVARMASGGRHGLAQSIFQVGGNAGSATGPLLAAAIILPHGQRSLAWFSVAALVALFVLWRIGGWYKRERGKKTGQRGPNRNMSSGLRPRQIRWALMVLMLLVFSKYFYLASLNTYYTFFLIHKFHLSMRSAQLHLFVFLFAVALGTILGGPIGDRIGRKSVIWISILGVAPFTLALPYVDLAWTGVLTFVIGLILASAFSAILVFAQELVPGRMGAVSGLFFGLAFGMAGIGAAVLGRLADLRGIESVYRLCAFLPLLGVFAAFLPDMRKQNSVAGAH